MDIIAKKRQLSIDRCRLFYVFKIYISYCGIIKYQGLYVKSEDENSSYPLSNALYFM